MRFNRNKITNAVISLPRQNSIATILSLSDEISLGQEQILPSCESNDLLFKGNIISVSSYDLLSPIAKMLRAKQNDLGMWTRKRRVTLEIGRL